MCVPVSGRGGAGGAKEGERDDKAAWRLASKQWHAAS